MRARNEAFSSAKFANAAGLIEKWLRLYSVHFFAIFAVVFVYINFIPVQSGDINVILSGWFDHLQANGRLAALGDGPWNYTAPYVTLLAGFSYLDALMSDAAVIKVLSIVGALAGASVIVLVCRRFAFSIKQSLLIGLGFLLAPTIALNAAAWGQADIFYTAFLLLSMLALLNMRAAWAIAFFAMSLSFKLQAVFFGPFLLYMVWRLRANILWFAIVPPIYIVFNLPFVIAGQDFVDAMSVYWKQSLSVGHFSINCANLWFWVDRITIPMIEPHEAFLAFKDRVVMIVLPIVFVIGLAISLQGFRRRELGDADLVALAAFTTALMPYILPMMFDRYFYPAECFAFLLMIIRPKTWHIFALLQISALIVYTNFFAFLTMEPFFGYGWAPGVASIFTTAALVFLWRQVATPVFGLQGLAALDIFATRGGSPAAERA